MVVHGATSCNVNEKLTDLDTNPTDPGLYNLQWIILSNVPAVSPILNAPAWIPPTVEGPRITYTVHASSGINYFTESSHAQRRENSNNQLPNHKKASSPTWKTAIMMGLIRGLIRGNQRRLLASNIKIWPLDWSTWEGYFSTLLLARAYAINLLASASGTPSAMIATTLIVGCLSASMEDEYALQTHNDLVTAYPAL